MNDIRNMAELVARIEELEAQNDRLARLAAAAGKVLEEGKRDLMAHGWDQGYADGLRQDAEGDDGPRFVNPYRQPLDLPGGDL